MTRLITTGISILGSLLIVLPIWGQTIEKINLEIDGIISETEYQEYLEVGKGAKYGNTTDSLVIQGLSSCLVENGYYYFEINELAKQISSDSSTVVLSYQVIEGDPVYLGNIYLENVAGIDSSYLMDEMDFLIGEVFIVSEIEESFSEILTFYENDAFPFASLRISSIQFRQDSVENNNYADLYLEIDKGPPSRIDKIEIDGNEKTKDYVIIRELRFKPGEEYSQERLEEIPKLLNRLKFFESVNEPVYYFNSDDEGVLRIKVKDKETNNFDGIIGYVPGQGENDKGYVTGFVNINLRNLFGSGRAAAIKWEKLDRHSELLKLKYLEPWILGMPFNIQGGFFQRKQDTSWVQRMFDVRVDYMATENISASLLFESEATIPTENINSSFTVFNSSAYTTGIDVRYDSRDDVYAPSEGILFGSVFKYSQKKINGPDEFLTEFIKRSSALKRIEVNLEFFVEPFKRQVFAIGGHMRELRGDLIEVSDLYRLGGTNTLRGYREDQFRGNRIIWSNFEYRYAMTKITYAYLFYDMGYYLQNENKSQNLKRLSEFKTGYGLGLSIETALGIMGISYALGQGDSFGEGKIHFGLLNEF